MHFTSMLRNIVSSEDSLNNIIKHHHINTIYNSNAKRKRNKQKKSFNTAEISKNFTVIHFIGLKLQLDLWCEQHSYLFISFSLFWVGEGV